MVAPGIGLVHADGDRYPDPETFDPDRMLDAQLGPTTWLPFGGGNRRCLGANFALETLKAKTAFVMVDQANDYVKGLAENFDKAFKAKDIPKINELVKLIDKYQILDTRPNMILLLEKLIQFQASEAVQILSALIRKM